MLIEFEVNFKLPIIGFLLILGRGEKLHDVILGEQGANLDSYDLLYGTAKLEVELKDSDETVCGDGNMDLDTHRIITLSPEELDFEMLFDPFEEQFDLPPATTAFKALKQSGNKSYRRNSVCHNYIDLLASSDSLEYKEEYIKEYGPYIDITLLIDEGDTPAYKVEMHGRYHLLKFEDWDYKSLYSIFGYNSTLIGKPTHITVEKDCVIQSFYFGNRIGSTIVVKYIDAVDKAAIIEKYEMQKQRNYEIY